MDRGRSRSVGTMAALLALVSIGGCQTHQIGSPAESGVRLAELEARAARAPALVRTAEDGTWTAGRDLSLDADSLRWLDEVGDARALHRSQVEAVRFERRRQGMIGWTLVGASLGALAGASQGDDDTRFWDMDEVYLGAGLGAVTGLIVGWQYGLPVTYRFGSP